MNVFALTKKWFEFAMDNRECKAVHTALFFWLIEKNNSLNWKKEFGLPTDQAMEVLSIGNYKTYTDALKMLNEWGFIKIVVPGRNQYQACIVSIWHFKSEEANTKAPAKAPPEALTEPIEEHRQEQSESNDKSSASIDKHLKTNKTIEIEERDQSPEVALVYRKFKHLSLSFAEYEKLLGVGYSKSQIDTKLDAIENHKKNKDYVSLYLTALNWLKKDYPKIMEKSGLMVIGRVPIVDQKEFIHGDPDKAITGYREVFEGEYVPPTMIWEVDKIEYYRTHPRV